MEVERAEDRIKNLLLFLKELISYKHHVYNCSETKNWETCVENNFVKVYR